MNKLINLGIVLTISVVMVSSILIPIITTAQDSTYDKVYYQNESEDSISMSKINGGETLACNAEGITTPTGAIAYWGNTDYFNTIILTDSLFLWTNGASISGGSFVGEYNAITATSIQITIGAEELTYTADSSDPVTIPYEAGYIANAAGDYLSVFSTTDVPIYYGDDAELSGWRISSGVTFVLIDGQGKQNGVDATNIHITSADVDGTEGQIKQLSGISFGSKSINAWVLPKTVVYKHTDYPEYIALYTVIPLLAIVSIIVAVAYQIKSRA